MPTLATNDYVTRFATYVASHLNSDLTAYMEYSNETWNFGFSQWQQLINMGAAAGSGVYLQYPTASNGCSTGGNSYDCNRSVMGHQTVQFCASWKTAFGSNARQVKCIMGAQAANPFSAQDAFGCPAYVSGPCTAGIDYVAIAPYFGGDASTPSNPNYNPAWLSQTDGGLTSLFTAIQKGGNLAGFPGEPPGNESMLAMVSAWEVAYQAIAKTYNVGVLGYESGQAFSSFQYDPQFTNLFVAAQTDLRMGTVYTSYYNTWAANGGGLIMHFDDVSAYGKFGSWGAVQNLSLPASSPKYNALVAFASGSPPPPPPPPAAAATNTRDFNGDGKSDLNLRDENGDMSVWLMDGAAISLSASIGRVNTQWSVVGQRDFNGDGKADLLWRDSSGNTSIWYMNGTQVSSSAIVGNIPTIWSVAATGDFNGDGKGDIIWEQNSNYAIWLMNGNIAASNAPLALVPVSWRIAGIGDFDGDGKSDILWRDTGGSTAIWFMNGMQVSSSSGIGNIPTTWAVIGTGDFDGDGKSDIVWRDASGNVSITLMSGSQVLSSKGLGAIPTTWSLVLTGDYNGDGKSDLLWQDTSGDLAIWFMNGTKVSSSMSVGNISTVWTVQSANAQ
jgi:FG-GAP-like repeat